MDTATLWRWILAIDLPLKTKRLGFSPEQRPHGREEAIYAHPLLLTGTSVGIENGIRITARLPWICDPLLYGMAFRFPFLSLPSSPDKAVCPVEQLNKTASGA